MAFEILVAKNGNDAVITLKDLTEKSSAEIYTFGALLNNFSAQHHNETINVIEGFSSIEDAKQNLTPFFKSAKLSPYVCRIKDGKYKFGEGTFELKKYASNGNAMHGLLYDRTFSIANQWQNESEAAVVLEYLYDNQQEGFLFYYKCSVEYKLSVNNILSVSTTITNLDNKLMPITDGWHPYFTLGDSINDYLVEFQSKTMLEFDDKLIPTGKQIPYETFGSLTLLGNTFFDNCFALDFTECQPLCVVRNPLKNIQVEFYPEKSYPYLQIYTPDSRKSIAIENLSAPPDAFNNGIDLKILQPGEEATFSVKYKIKSL